MPQILIVGGGYAGFYTAWKLEKQLRRGEAVVTLVDPLPYMTYQPFLPEVAAGSVESRHAVVSLRRHLRKTTIITAAVSHIDHATKTATITPAEGEPWTMTYDHVVVTAGAVTRTFPIPGVADNAIGLKTIEEATNLRDRMLANFDRAANLPDGPERDRLLTVVVVGGGFNGIEVLGELRSLASSLIKYYPRISFDDTQFHLVEAMSRIMPEVSLKTAEKVVQQYIQRGVQMHLDTQLTSAVDGVVEMSSGLIVETDMIIWSAGVMANPVVKNTDLPLDDRGRLRVQPDLRVVGDDGVIEGAWGAGDVAAVPDLTGGGVGGYCVPNAQHAVRQAKRLSKNLVALLRGEVPVEYKHKGLGAVAGLGVGHGAFQSGKFGFTGPLAWIAHRGYHGLAVPTVERKMRVFGNWLFNFLATRDIVGLEAIQTPRAAFEAVAARPKPAVEKPAEKPSSESTAAKVDTEKVAVTAAAAKAPSGKAPSGKAPAKKAPAAKAATATAPAKAPTSKAAASRAAATAATKAPATKATPKETDSAADSTEKADPSKA
ncbi:NAD(P)/FAD-dependent oxidoreductase [Homoserinimonas sp. OAct 916]|uniref:NAD(P)/FAD-dependent oxidoreductase n=1 Tax=Homoserinimonas sp. OAct 916 TaxID=2211450 RepID=UPI000DBEA1FC|nr:FAD-dependent oxidoreductase [Homoserinimonas sp. OAct 916]